MANKFVELVKAGLEAGKTYKQIAQETRTNYQRVYKNAERMGLRKPRVENPWVVNINFRISQPMHDALVERADKTEQEISTVLRAALQEYLCLEKTSNST